MISSHILLEVWLILHAAIKVYKRDHKCLLYWNGSVKQQTLEQQQVAGFI